MRRHEKTGKRALTDVAFAVVCDDDVCEALVDGHVLLERCALVE